MGNSNLWDLLYPPRCPLCGEILASGEGETHEKCYEKLPWVREPICKRCGKPMMSPGGDVREFCQDCLRNYHRQKKSFDQGRALWIYEGDIQKSVLDFKYKGMKTYADFYGSEVVRVWGGWIRRKNPDVLIPVPIHARKKRIRGFNQAELLAKVIGKKMDLTVRNDILCRNRWTEPQKSISGQERRHNLTKSIEIRNLPIGIRRVKLIEEIYTTGSTLEACAWILKENGVEEVDFLTLCIGLGTG